MKKANWVPLVASLVVVGLVYLSSWYFSKLLVPVTYAQGVSTPDTNNDELSLQNIYLPVIVDGQNNQSTPPSSSTPTATATATSTPSPTSTSTLTPTPTQDPKQTNVDIPIEGGTIALPSYITITFPSQVFTSSHTVKVQATESSKTDQEFQESTDIFAVNERLLYEIRINTGTISPTKDIEATVIVPDVLLNSIPVTGGIQAFVQVWQYSGEENLDNFELVASTFNSTTKTSQVTILKDYFTDVRTEDGTFEAVLTLAGTPGQSPSMVRSVSEFVDHLSINDCEGATLGSPLEREPEVTRHFNPAGETHPVTGETTPHYGTDFRANDGDPVIAVADGRVEVVDYQVKQTKKGLTGWGHYIVLRHIDGSATLYGHLKAGSLISQGTSVTKGQRIAEADSSGGVSGPHLHFEYAPNGQIFNKPSKIDPFPCIGNNVKGNINVADIGPVFDDIFEVSLGKLVLGRTAQGGANSFAVSNLRSGTYTLTVKCILDGTKGRAAFGVTLDGGLQFENGSTYVEGIIDEGGAASYTVVVP